MAKPFARWVAIAAVLVSGNWAALACIDAVKTRQLAAQHSVSPAVIRKFQLRTIEVPLAGSRRIVSYAYRFRPPHRSAGPRSVPLLVYLHSAAECGDDTVRQLLDVPSLMCTDRMYNSYSCALLAPQCPLPGGWSQRVDSEADLIDVVLAMIEDAMLDVRIDPSRVYLAGLSMGGTGTWAMAIRSPERFAAIVPLCGESNLDGVNRIVDVPVWAVHGTVDDVIPVSETRKMIKALETAGGKPRFMELSGVGHICWESVFRPDSKVLDWMFRQRRE